MDKHGRNPTVLLKYMRVWRKRRIASVFGANCTWVCTLCGSKGIGRCDSILKLKRDGCLNCYGKHPDSKPTGGSARVYEVFGVEMLAADVERVFGTPRAVLESRLRGGWEVEEAVFSKVRRAAKHRDARKFDDETCLAIQEIEAHLDTVAAMVSSHLGYTPATARKYAALGFSESLADGLKEALAHEALDEYTKALERESEALKSEESARERSKPNGDSGDKR